ncbi:uroporphyrinogen decarboxylase family protein [Chloroflexota bacterium]
MAADKSDQEELKRLKEEVEQKEGKSIEQLYKERKQRVRDASELRVPDRVPVAVGFSYFPAKFTGITVKDAFYDFKKWRTAYLKTAVYFQPDRLGLSFNQSGLMLETLVSKQTLWPGHGVPPNHSHQFVEGEYMKAEEYDEFLEDTTDFLIRRYFPRVYGIMEPLAGLPSLSSMLGNIPLNELIAPEYTTMFEALVKAAHLQVEWQAELVETNRELIELGFPAESGIGGAGAPFDSISDFLRGMRGTMLDMLRLPDKLHAAIDLISRRQMKRIEALPEASEFGLSFVALHRGADGFMSNRQFEEFYWPPLLKSINAVVKKGYTPIIFFEGDYTSRIEYLRQLPKGKVVGKFDCSDIRRVKEVLGGHICITGNVPASLLQAGTVQEVKDYCRFLIDVVGKDGGFILEPASSLDEVNPDNLKAMIDFTKEYGVYK